MLPFPDCVTIYRSTTAVDAYGDQSSTGWQLHGRVSGVFAPVQSDTADQAGRTTVSNLRDLIADFCVDVQPGDRVKDDDGMWWQATGHPQRWPYVFTGGKAGSVTRFELVEG